MTGGGGTSSSSSGSQSVTSPWAFRGKGGWGFISIAVGFLSQERKNMRGSGKGVARGGGGRVSEGAFRRPGKGGGRGEKGGRG